MANLIQTAHHWFDIDAIVLVERRSDHACLVVYDRVTPDGQFVTAVLHGDTAQELMALLKDMDTAQRAREAAELHAWEAAGFATAQDDTPTETDLCPYCHQTTHVVGCPYHPAS